MNKPQYYHLSFPLNVYAHSLYLQQHQVEYLHYGLLEDNEDPWEVGALKAQQRSSELILAHLPPPPARILEIGVGLGTLSALLTQKGYQVTGISPDPYQIALAKARAINRFNLQCVSFEEFNTLAKNFDIIVLQESAQYLDTLLLFNKAYRLLTENGLMLIIDEVSLQRRPSNDIEGLPLLKYTLAQAQRCGFKVLKQVDLSKKAAPTLDYLLKAIQHHRTQLHTDLALPQAQLEALLDSLRRYQQKYRDGRYGYVFLLLQKYRQPRWHIQAVTPQHQEAVRTLFSQVFENNMSAALWNWKYDRGRGMATAAWRDHTMVAHYGGIIRALSYFGQPKTGVQIVDVMVATQERGVLTRQGPYFLVGATFPECYAGYGNRILLGFGFPTAKAIRIAERLGLYAEVGKMVEIQWIAASARPRLWTRIRHLQPQDKPSDRVIIDQLWHQMRNQLPYAIVGVRDWPYIQHRYLAHPHKHYELLLINKRFSGKPLGIVVLYREQDNCKLLDIIAPLHHIPVVIQQTRRIIGNWGLKTLSLWITENFAELFLQTGGQAHAIDVRIPHCIWYEGPPVEEVQGKWWLMGGDTDFM
ncbi:MAG: GNAT family N-acetyltransferase [Pseudomonadota bacterium]|nr:GNAT family N-acetyltransferase [Pseudomonadota bacterium]